jgi:hypothetical protein
VYIDFKLENSNNSSLTEPKLAVFQIFRPASKGGHFASKKRITKGGGGGGGGKVDLELALLFFC